MVNQFFILSTEKRMSVASSIYSGAAEYGRAVSWIGAFLGTMIALVFIGLGVFLATRSQNKLLKITATIQPNSQCTFNSSNQNYACTLNLAYVVNGTSYTNQWVTTTSVNYQPGTTIPITVSAVNPQLITSPSPIRWIGWVLIGIGIFVLIISWVGVWTASHSKFYAASTGISSALGGSHNIIQV
jgi:hypothetical protein